ncbi:MAG: SagB/ThcOx family dehydrogenase [Hydrococcus sp. C42_A2020_068]|nr:SagB/ThcOx family dehydrogenase [Hydrococcus sp. C42_A2020_068]
MLGSLYLFVSGLLMDTIGLHRFAFHTQVGYAWVALAVLHLSLNWGRVKVYWGHRFWHGDRERVQHLEPHQETGRRNLLVWAAAIAGSFFLGRLLPYRSTAELPDGMTDVGLYYHQWSKPGAAQALGAILNWGEPPARYKTYPDAEQIKLPNPQGYQGLSLETAIATRRSQRDYTDAPLSLIQLSRLLHLAQGITQSDRELRSVPSAGALYPLEIYTVVHRVEGLPAGIYHYAVQTHQLERLKSGDFRTNLVMAGLGKGFLAKASVCLVISAIFQRTRWKYRVRTYRYVLMEAGHLGQNIYLTATSLELGACAIGAFFG